MLRSRDYSVSSSKWATEENAVLKLSEEDLTRAELLGRLWGMAVLLVLSTGMMVWALLGCPASFLN
jgi:hypothetical protein